LSWINVETLNQCLGFWIGFGIQPYIRMGVAAEKALEPQYVAAVGTADDHRATRARLHQSDPAQDERAHDPLAQFRLGDEQ
jgi:hypothetical protein